MLAVRKTNGSAIAPGSGAVPFCTNAGREIAVTSTTAFLTQLIVCYLLALYLRQVLSGTHAVETHFELFLTTSPIGVGGSERLHRRTETCAES